MRMSKADQKRRRACQRIIGLPVLSAFENKSFPNGVALAWTGKTEAYLVNFQKKTAKEYVRDGKFLMHRALLPIKVWIEKRKI
jgi:hypothetical protein